MRTPSLVCLSYCTVWIQRGRKPRSCNQKQQLASLAIGGKGHRGPFVYSVQWDSARHNLGQALSVLLAEFHLDKRLVLESKEQLDSWFREWPEWQAKWLLKVTLPINSREKPRYTALFVFQAPGSIWSYQLPRDKARHLIGLSSQKDENTSHFYTMSQITT